MRTRKRVKKEKRSERNLLPVAVGGGRALTAREFQGLADVPPEAEWIANIDNRQTRRAYQNDIKDFMTFLRDETGSVAVEQSQSRAPLRLMVSGQPGRSTRRCSRCGAPGHIQSGGSEDRANPHTS